MTRIRIRTPDGQTLTRRFLAVNTLQVLLNYVTSCGYHATDYKVLTTFPRRDVSRAHILQQIDGLVCFILTPDSTY